MVPYQFPCFEARNCTNHHNIISELIIKKNIRLCSVHDIGNDEYLSWRIIYECTEYSDASRQLYSDDIYHAVMDCRWK